MAVGITGLGVVKTHVMFGGTESYRDRIMFARIAAVLCIKADTQNRPISSQQGMTAFFISET